MKNVSISLLKLNDEDLDNYLSRVNDIRKVYENLNITIHFDVMDNIFVPNSGIDIKKIANVKEYNLYIDTHLMVENPKQYIDTAIRLGSNDVTIHYEIPEFEKWLKYLLEKKKSLNGNLKIGVSIKPNTNVDALEKYINDIDKILVMSVEPGFGGQKYMDIANDKIRRIKEKYANIFVQVDGGINDKTLNQPLEAGADSFVMGSYLTDNIEELSNRIEVINKIINEFERN